MSSITELAQKLARTPRILIVDDDDLIRFAFSNVEQKYYLDVDCIADPDRTVGMIQENHYDAIFLDMKFETGQNGMDTLRKINLINFQAPLIVMSGSINLPAVMAEANQLGVLSFMIKPINFTHDFIVGILRRIGLRLVLRPLEDPGPKPALPKPMI